MSSGKTVCKEVCSKCKCIVKERPLNKESKPSENKPSDEGKKDCTATIVGVITLPENMCNNNNEKKFEDKKKDDCTEVYRDLGECLQKAIVKVSCGNDNDMKRRRNDDC